MILGISTNYFKVLQILARKNGDLKEFINNLGNVVIETNKVMQERTVGTSYKLVDKNTDRRMFTQDTIDAFSKASNVANTMANRSKDDGYEIGE